jgi:hypothetical protein
MLSTDPCRSRPAGAADEAGDDGDELVGVHGPGDAETPAADVRSSGLGRPVRMIQVDRYVVRTLQFKRDR